MQRLHLRAVLVVAVVGLAAGALGGVAAAQDLGDSEIDSNTSVAVNDEGGYASVHCTGSPINHECDKSGALDAGPVAIDYEGFNDDSADNRSSRFGDHFVFTVDGEQYTVAFTCEFTDEPPEGNPCPVDAPGDGGDDGSGDESDGQSDESDDGNDGNGGGGDTRDGDGGR